MKVSFLLLISLFFYLNCNAQTPTPEPDFIGEVLSISTAGEAILLEKANAQVKTYGISSYLLTINNIEKGEYGVTINNPNTVDEKMLIVSCFGVDE